MITKDEISVYIAIEGLIMEGRDLLEASVRVCESLIRASIEYGLPKQIVVLYPQIEVWVSGLASAYRVDKKWLLDKFMTVMGDENVVDYVIEKYGLQT